MSIENGDRETAFFMQLQCLSFGRGDCCLCLSLCVTVSLCNSCYTASSVVAEGVFAVT